MHTRLLSPLENASATTSQTLAQAIGCALEKSGYIELRELDIRVANGQVNIYGCLPSYYLKQLAMHIISGVHGIHSVVDHIDVVS